jgi:hypothetical protein
MMDINPEFIEEPEKHVKEISAKAIKKAGHLEGTIDGIDIQKMAVDECSIAHGELGEAGTGKAWPITYLEFTTQSGDVFRVILSLHDSMFLAEQLVEWIDQLHEQSQCECQKAEHPHRNRDANTLTNISEAFELMKEIGGGTDHDGLWR